MRCLYQDLNPLPVCVFFFLKSTNSAYTLMDLIFFFCCFVLVLLVKVAFPLIATIFRTCYEKIPLKQIIFKTSNIKQDNSSEVS